MRIAFDIGGTFTDVLALSSDRRLATAKVLSLIDKVGDDIVACLKELNPEGKVDQFIHGTTICSNAVIENKLAKTGLIVTRGFRDVLPMRDQRGPSSPTVNWRAPDPLVDRTLCLEVNERVLANGKVDRALDEADVMAAINAFKGAGVEAVAVCLINSYLNPEHERRIGELLAKHSPNTVVCLSCDISPEVREYPRASTTVINAALTPVVVRYVDRLEARLSAHSRDGGGIQIMQSNGGIMTSRFARRRPVYMVESGPAAGVLAAARFASEAKLPHVISFDMGGTTAKACLIRNGVPLEKAQVSIGAASTAGGWSQDLGHVVRVPSIDLVEVGAGGGSIAWIEGGVLRVGPHSAGADPGPVCYGRGGREPTVTDANVVLGSISPMAIGQGRLAIDREAALAAFERLGSALGVDALHAAFGVTEVANAVMMRALRAVSVERGFDAREFVLMAFGGAGPIHAAALAESIGIRQVLVPSFPGLFSALGLLLADYRVDHIASLGRPLDSLGSADIIARLRALEEEARADLERSGVPAAGGHANEVRFERKVDVRYAHQITELSLAAPDELLNDALRDTLRTQFVAAHEREFGFPGRGEIVLVNLRLRAIAPGEPLQLSEVAALSVSNAPAPSMTKRRIYFGPQHGMHEVAVCSRAMITDARTGPLVVEEPDTTVVVPPGWSVRRDAAGTLVLDRQG
jgi:N-methylhydantoinase A